MVHSRSFTNICWMNKCVGHNTPWHVITSGIQQSGDSRFHTLQVISYGSKGVISLWPSPSSFQQSSFHLYGSRSYTKNRFLYLGEFFFSEIIILLLFLISLPVVFICSLLIWWCQTKYIWLLFGLFRTYSAVLKMCHRALSSLVIENRHHFYVIGYCGCLTRFYYEWMTSWSFL